MRSVRQLAARIRELPADRPKVTPGQWYRTQKEHWLGWLAEYQTPGGYGRTPDLSRGAQYAYNHILCPPMLLAR